ncbi:MAG: cysteine methyltransferase [Firmicutes bacterium]|nr:cysteine methyltransferase [Bacillota bacterium]
MKSIFFYQTVIGKIGIADNGEAIIQLTFDDGKIPVDALVKETPLIKEAAQQIKEYLSGKRKVFDIPIAANGTVFQQNVWEALKAIPYGETRSYKDIAESIGQPKACRAVGMANNRNPIALMVPCHRVIGANGKLVGYGGGLDIKEKLLNLEKTHRN